jgi:hypothetical protein
MTQTPDDFNFIDYFIDYNKEAESPLEFWRWAAIGTIASTLCSHVFLPVRPIRIYPNMFIIIYSGSGLARKASPCKFASRLLTEVNSTRFINGRATMQAVIRELATSHTTSTGDMIKGAHGLLYTEELASFLVQDPAAIPILTDLYDFHEKWSTNLISGSYKLEQVCLSLLCASNSRLFKDVFNDSAVYGGLLGRCFIIDQPKARHRRSLLEMPENTNDISPLINHLKKLRKLRGPIAIDKQATKYCNDWYNDMPSEYFEDNIGFSSRLQTHVLKVAMALGAARADFNSIINLDDMLESIRLCGELKKAYKGLTVASGESPLAQQTALILKIIAQQPNMAIERSKLMGMVIGDVTGPEFEQITELLDNAEFISFAPYNGKLVYSLTQKGKEEIFS